MGIVRRIEEAPGNRSGQRTDFHNIGELPQKFGEVEPGQKTRQVTAEKAGFGNPETYRQAKALVESGNEKKTRQALPALAQNPLFITLSITQLL